MANTNNGTGWKDIPIGGMIIEAGNAVKYPTGTWRAFRPIWDEPRCIHCLQCWVMCPDSSIMVNDGKMIGIDLLHCKGCGICAEVCPDKVKCIDMVEEAVAAETEGK
jgi:pyruvate ferredoxin oxidoreductase delta subunit